MILWCICTLLSDTWDYPFPWDFEFATTKGIKKIYMYMYVCMIIYDLYDQLIDLPIYIYQGPI